MTFKNVSIKIINSGPKWTNIKYPASSAKSRMPTDKLVREYKSGKINVLNPDLLEVGEEASK